MLKRFGLVAFFILTGCAVYQSGVLEQKYGVEEPHHRQALQAGGLIDYWTDVKPILDNRCVVCHGCYDAPCQLKLEAPVGLERGASKAKVYGTRLTAASPERLFEDEYSVAEWRNKGFYPVLNEREQNLQANKDSSLLYQMLKLKQEHPVSDEPLLPPTIDVALTRGEICPTSEEFSDYKQQFPGWGMPFGLPKLAEGEEQVLMQWLEGGAHYGSDPLLGNKHEVEVALWEAFLNGPLLKEQLVSRYIYEHLFLADIYFSSAQRDFYRLVRSASAPGEPLDKIATRRPYDDPGVDRVFYRLEKYPGTTLVKNHMPYRFDNDRMERYRALFLNEEYTVARLPIYDPAQSSNPFITFKDLPVKSRYEFMLDEAKFTIMGFIKGAVCRGQVALDVVDDHFWVVFEDPENATISHDAEFLAKESQHLRLPSSDGSTVLSVTSWHHYAKLQKAYLKAKFGYIDGLEKENELKVNLDFVWDGDKTNKNAALTIFRHFDSATVVQGFVGDKPKTGWLIGYPLLERIHYLLVAGFDIYGNAGHQLETRLYMDFLRMEGEANLLALLPKEDRKKVHKYWYRGAKKRVQDYVYADKFVATEDSEIVFKTKNVKSELFDYLNQHVGGAINNEYMIAENSDSEEIKMKSMEVFRGDKVSLLAQMSLILLSDSNKGTEQVFTIINHSAHSNISHLFGEEKRRLYEEDTLTVARGFIGAYPNAFFSVDVENLDDFVSGVLGLKDEADYFRLKSKYGVRRTDPEFWLFSDRIHNIQQRMMPVAWGLLDYNRLENR